MEMPASLASATDGRPLGTERLSVLPAFVRASAGSTGETFGAEVARAIERARGDGLERKRLDELEGARRDARRASFGHEREEKSEGEARAVEAVFRSEHAPVRVEPASTSDPTEASPLEPNRETAPPVMCRPCASESASAPQDAVLPSGTAIPPSLQMAPVAATSVVPRATSELPLLTSAPASESQPPELAPVARLGTRVVEPASAAPPPAGPDPAVLERAAEILRQIQLHATPFVRRLTLDLEPAELGRLSVQLALRAGRVAAIVRAEKPETLALLEQREAELLQVLSQRGIAADSVRFEHGFGDQRSRRGPRASAAAPAAASTPATPGSSTVPRHRSVRIDLYA